jgi:hypothetical protein
VLQGGNPRRNYVRVELIHEPANEDGAERSSHLQHRGNEILTTLGSKVIPRSRFQIDERKRQRQEYLEHINHEHEDIYNAILRGDPEAARAAVRNHLGNSRERMRRIAEARNSEAADPEEFDTDRWQNRHLPANLDSAG